MNSQEVLNSFFDNLSKELEGVPASNIWKYNETNLQDDPGAIKVITKRGAKYPERIQNSSKACTSSMFTCSAAGELVPLYVNYKAEHMWDQWTEGGPPGARYNRSKSGWFDFTVFEERFFSLILPLLKAQEGRKVLIGDNLSSHVNLRVIEACEQHNIAFLASPPNATHLLQSLDVAFFRPVKVACYSSRLLYIVK